MENILAAIFTVIVLLTIGYQQETRFEKEMAHHSQSILATQSRLMAALKKEQASLKEINASMSQAMHENIHNGFKSENHFATCAEALAQTTQKQIRILKNILSLGFPEEKKRLGSWFNKGNRHTYCANISRIKKIRKGAESWLRKANETFLAAKEWRVPNDSLDEAGNVAAVSIERRSSSWKRI